MKEVPGKGRFELSGSGRDLTRAIIKIRSEGLVPKGYVRISAKEFLKNSEKYSTKGRWLEFDVES